MKNTARFLLLSLLMLGGLAWWWKNQPRLPLHPSAAKTVSEVYAVATAISSAKIASPPVIERRPAGNQSELTSLAAMSQTLYQFTRPAIELKALVDYLETTRQDPMVVRDANAYTGEMAIVRTRAPLPGTRYFHAQYFGDENGQAFVQHMSFEFKPSPSAMDDAIAAVQQAFGLGQPALRREDYAQWKYNEGYIVWVKKMDIGDLQDDPFNAYTSVDTGTIRVAIEAEIH